MDCDCPLWTVGRMGKLQNLFIGYSRGEFDLLWLFSATFNQLKELYVSNCIDSLIKSLLHLTNLISLHYVSSLAGENADFGVINLPQLKILSVRGVRVVTLSQLPNLISLDISDGFLLAGSLGDDKEIFSRLHSFSGCYDPDNFCECDLKLFSKLRIFTYDEFGFTVEGSRSWSKNEFPTYAHSFDLSAAPKEMKSLNLHLPLHNITGLSSERSFLDVSIEYFSGNDISMFRNVKQLRLYCCPELTDIKPICHVPYLSLKWCDKLSDFKLCGFSTTLLIDWSLSWSSK
jgi:hypothetical protein